MEPALRLRLAASFFAACFATVGCGRDDVAQSGGDSENALPATISSFTWENDETWWRYEVQIDGWADRVELHIDELSLGAGADWTEDHSLIQGPFDPHGAWDSYAITLPVVLNTNNQSANRSTACTADAEPRMSWMVAAFSGGWSADCVVAAGSEADTEPWADYGCR
jgi:hypothetical protein